MKLVVLSFLFGAFTQVVFAGVPMQFTLSNVEGVIVDWVYRKEIEYERDTEGSGWSYKVPAHYIVVLEKVKKEGADLKSISNLARMMGFSDEIFAAEDKKGRVILVIFGERKAEKIKIGSVLRMKEYTIKVSGGGQVETAVQE